MDCDEEAPPPVIDLVDDDLVEDGGDGGGRPPPSKGKGRARGPSSGAAAPRHGLRPETEKEEEGGEKAEEERRLTAEDNVGEVVGLRSEERSRVPGGASSSDDGGQHKVWHDSDFDTPNAERIDAIEADHPPDKEEEDPLEGEDEEDTAYFGAALCEDEAITAGLMKQLNINRAQALVLTDMQIDYPTTADLFLEGVREGGACRLAKECEVVRDSRKIFDSEDDSNRPGRSLLAATLLAGFTKTVMLNSGDPLPGDLRRRVLRFWDKPVSLLGLVHFSAESVPGGDFSAERERVDGDLHRLGSTWLRRCLGVVRELAAAGFTNGAAMCLRGRTIKVDGVVGPFPLSLPGEGNANPSTVALSFGPIDRMLLAVAAATADDQRVALAGAQKALADATSAADETSAVAPSGDVPSATGLVSSASNDPGSSNRLSTDTSAIQLGSAMRIGVSRVVMRPVEGQMGANLAGLYSQKRGFFGAMMDAMTSNHGFALFYRALPAALQSLFNTHGPLRVTSTMEDGTQQEFSLFVKRLKGSGSLFDDLVESGRLCEKNDPGNSPDRDTACDVNVFPPSANLYGTSMKVLTTSTPAPSMAFHESSADFLKGKGVADEHIPSRDSPGLSFSTMSKAMQKVQSYAKSSTGTTVYVPGSLNLTDARYRIRQAREVAQLAMIRKGLRDDILAKKHTQDREYVGQEECVHALQATWTSDLVSIREAAFMVSLLSCMGIRTGVLTGILMRDIRIDSILKGSRMRKNDGGEQYLIHRVLRMEIDIFTKKHGDIDGRGRALGSGPLDRQDRSSARKTTFTITSSPELPVFLDAVIQGLRLFEANGCLGASLVSCLHDLSFPMRYRTFHVGVDCSCSADVHKHQAAPPLSVWKRTHERLNVGPDGSKIVCEGCGEVDRLGTHTPEAIDDQQNGLAIPGAKSASACTALFKRFFSLVGLHAFRLTPYSCRRWNTKTVYRLGGRGAAVSGLGHNNDSTVNVYYSSESRQAEGGHHSSVDFVGQGGTTDAKDTWSGGPIVTLTHPEALNSADMGGAVALSGYVRYCRLPTAFIREMAKLAVVEEAEKKLVAETRKDARKLDALIPEQPGGGADPETFSKDVDFTAYGWAAACLELSAKLFAKSPDKKKIAKDIVEGMVRRLMTEAVNPERKLASALVKSYRKQLALDAAAAPVRKERVSFMGEARRRWKAASERENGLRELAEGFLSLAALAVQRIPHDRNREVAEAAELRRTLLARRNRERARLNKGNEEEDRCMVSEHDIKLMTTPLCALKTYFSTTAFIPRSGRKWINGLPWHQEKPTGGRAGRQKGATQHNRAKDSSPSNTGVRRHNQHGNMVIAVECFGDNRECRSLFLSSQVVNKTLAQHLKTAHGLKDEELRKEHALERYVCPCSDSSHLDEDGEAILVDPATVFAHLKRRKEPTAEVKAGRESRAHLRNQVKDLLLKAERIVALGDMPITEEFSAECSISFAEFAKHLPDMCAAVGLRMASGTPLIPVKPSFTVKQVGKEGDRLDTYVIQFACPSACAEYTKSGFRRYDTFRKKHLAKCHNGEASHFKCPFGGGCQARGKSRFFTAKSLELHLRECKFGSVRDLCHPPAGADISGRLAALPWDTLLLTGDDWLTQKRAFDAGSPRFGARNDKVWIFSKHVSYGANRELVADPGYTLEKDAGVRISGGEAIAKAAGLADAAELIAAAAAVKEQNAKTQAATRARRTAWLRNKAKAKAGLVSAAVSAADETLVETPAAAPPATSSVQGKETPVDEGVDDDADLWEVVTRKNRRGHASLPTSQRSSAVENARRGRGVAAPAVAVSEKGASAQGGGAARGRKGPSKSRRGGTPSGFPPTGRTGSGLPSAASSKERPRASASSTAGVAGATSAAPGPRTYSQAVRAKQAVAIDLTDSPTPCAQGIGGGVSAVGAASPLSDEYHDDDVVVKTAKGRRSQRRIFEEDSEEEGSTTDNRGETSRPGGYVVSAPRRTGDDDEAVWNLVVGRGGRGRSSGDDSPSSSDVRGRRSTNEENKVVSKGKGAPGAGFVRGASTHKTVGPASRLSGRPINRGSPPLSPPHSPRAGTRPRGTSSQNRPIGASPRRGSMRSPTRYGAGKFRSGGARAVGREAGHSTPPRTSSPVGGSASSAAAAAAAAAAVAAASPASGATAPSAATSRYHRGHNTKRKEKFTPSSPPYAPPTQKPRELR